jgi:endonuclease YncB( thermonuclease family)
MKSGGKRFLLVAVLAGAIVVSGVDGSALRPGRGGVTAPATEPSLSRKPVKVLNVPSGDTVVVMWKNRATPVRLKGVSAPEKGDPRSREAMKLLKSLLRDKVVELGLESPPEIRRDDPGRLRVLVFADGECVNEEMIRAGWASSPSDGGASQSRKPSLTATEHLDQTNRDPSIPGTTELLPSSQVPSAANESTQRVYVTVHDKTYHNVRCRLLRGKRSIAILKTEAIRQGYKRCRRCRP